MGYTGNFVCGVWFGNDDYESTNRMTGGSLPAMTWHAIMAYAHQGIEIKAAAGHSGAGATGSRRRSPNSRPKPAEPPPPPRPLLLTKRGAEILVRVERMMDDANRAMGPPPPPSDPSSKKQQARHRPAPATRLRRRLGSGAALRHGTD